MSTSVSWEGVVGALVVVDDLPEGSTGLVTFGESGGIFVEHNRICWAASGGLNERLSELLRQHAGMGKAEFRTLFQECRAEGRPLGQTLVERGLVDPQLLRAALRRHSAESLVRFATADAEPHWQPRAQRGYTPQFTFGTVEILLAVAQLGHADEQAEVERVLAAFGTGERRGGAFLLDPELPLVLPLAALAPGTMTVSELLALGEWGATIASAASELGEELNVVVGTTAAQQSIAVWWRNRLLYAVPCADRVELAAVTSRHLSLGS